MKTNIEKSLEFNGTKIPFTPADGQWWIAIKPICEALGVHYEHQRESINADPMLSELPRHHRVVAADNKQREMLCLPEKYVYGWIFSIQSKSEALIAYKRECYDVLFDHFNGKNERLQQILNRREKAKNRVAQYEKELSETEAFKKLKAAQTELKQIPHQIKGLQDEIVLGQRPIWNMDDQDQN